MIGAAAHGDAIKSNADVMPLLKIKIEKSAIVQTSAEVNKSFGENVSAVET